MATTQQEIVYRVSVDNKQAVDGFKAIASAQNQVVKSTESMTRNTQNSNMLLMSTGRIVQDLPYGFMAVGNNITFMAEQMGYMRSQGMSAKEMLMGMVGALRGPMGIIFAISVATSVLTAFGNKLFGMGKSTEPAIKNVRSLRDEFRDLKNEVNQVVAALNFNDIIQMGQKKRGLTNLISSTQNQLDLETRPGYRTRLSLQLAGYKSELEAINKEQEFQNFAFQKWLDMQKESNKEIKETKDNFKEIDKIITGFSAEGKRINLANMGISSSMSDILGKQGDAKGKAGGARLTEGFQKQMMFINDQIRQSASLLSSEFKSAWEDIFGEANSLFEKFMMNIASSLAELAAQNLMNGILNWILPGAGSLAAMASGSQKQPVVIKIGEREFASLVNDANKNISTYRIN